MPTSNITSPVCGTILSSLTDLIYVKPVTKASNYEYKLTEKGTSNVYFYNNSIYRVQLSWFGPAIKYNTIYELEVRVYVNGDWGDYSSICEVTTPTIPSPNVASSQCGTTINSLTELIYYTNVKNASNYEYRLTEQGTSNVYLDSNSIYRVQLSWFGVNNIKPNTVYELQARAYVNGSWGNYGNICQITTPSAAMELNETARFMENQEVVGEVKTTTLSIYPNPNTGDQINMVMENLTPNSTVIITDIYGKVILNKPLNTDLNQYNLEVKFDGKLSTGFYFVTVISEGSRVTEKLIVR